MTAINRVPRGLQDFLGSRTLGQNPSDLLQSVRPQVDLSPFYLSALDFETTLTASGSVAIQGTYAVQTVPPDELWLIELISLQSFVIATTGIVAGRIVLVPASGVAGPISPGYSDTASAVGAIYLDSNAAERPIFGPGTRIGAEKLTAATESLSLTTTKRILKV